jgi:hypothetical protein
MDQLITSINTHNKSTMSKHSSKAFPSLIYSPHEVEEKSSRLYVETRLRSHTEYVPIYILKKKCFYLASCGKITIMVSKTNWIHAHEVMDKMSSGYLESHLIYQFLGQLDYDYASLTVPISRWSDTSYPQLLLSTATDGRRSQDFYVKSEISGPECLVKALDPVMNCWLGTLALLDGVPVWIILRAIKYAQSHADAEQLTHNATTS